MATIFCFSSTGNSLYTAKRISEKISGKVVPMHAAPWKCEEEVIGFVFPVYFWGLPRMVEHFVEELQIANKNAYIFAVATGGGNVFGVLGEVKKIIEKKGAKLQYGRNLCMVSNYIPEFQVRDNAKKQQKADEKTKRITEEIIHRKTRKILPPTVVNRVVQRFFPDEHSDRFFTVSPSCNGCRICQKVCPAKNIAMRDEKPGFLHKCEHCLACLHHCPVQAIDWKAKTQGRARYRHAGVALSELIASSSGAGEGPGNTAPQQAE